MSLHLADKSAWERRRHSQPAREVFTVLIETGTLATCGTVALELLYSARNLADYDQIRQALTAYEWLPTSDAVMRRALAVQHALARRGQHRLPLPDLIIAATAEAAGAVVLHSDSDFDRIAQITGQPTAWVAPRGV